MNEPQLIPQMIVVGALMAATIAVHAIFIASSAAVFRASTGHVHGPLRFVRDTVVLVLLGLWLIIAHMIEIAMWAWTYLRLGVFTAWEEALYFSGVSYTTLGFGGITLPDEWRLLAGATAAGGLLLFGMSAAFLVETGGKLRLGGHQ